MPDCHRLIMYAAVEEDLCQGSTAWELPVLVTANKVHVT